MKILSIDIGIKNLAFITIEHTNSNTELIIEKWDTINICNNIPKCSTCNKNANYKKNDIFFCNKHAKISEYYIPTINIKTLEKKNINDLYNIITTYDISCNKDFKNKSYILNTIIEHYKNNFLEKIESVNANNVNIIDLGINIFNEFNKLFKIINLKSIDNILIENQIGPIAIRMKTIQGMVAQYFINNNINNIEFISPINKLKLFCKDKKTNYNDRKKLSIQYTKELLYNFNITKYIEVFNNHSKKDDLADCFLQGIYYLYSNNNLVLK